MLSAEVDRFKWRTHFFRGTWALIVNITERTAEATLKCFPLIVGIHIFRQPSCCLHAPSCVRKEIGCRWLGSSSINCSFNWITDGIQKSTIFYSTTLLGKTWLIVCILIISAKPKSFFAFINIYSSFFVVYFISTKRRQAEFFLFAVLTTFA